MGTSHQFLKCEQSVWKRRLEVGEAQSLSLHQEASKAFLGPLTLSADIGY